jgi:hypothetical protein
MPAVHPAPESDCLLGRGPRRKVSLWFCVKAPAFTLLLIVIAVSPV